MKIIVTGDIHAQFGQLNTFINNKKPDILLCCGDFGYFPDEKLYSLKRIKPKDTKIYWCPGNHERWDLLEERFGRRGLIPIEIKPNIFYCPIGSYLKIEGKNILFIGGADSIDKDSRIIGIDWFPQEILNMNDVDFILNNSKERVDIIISHTCPDCFDMSRTERFDKWNDPSRKALDIILKQLNPKLYFFGHWHFSLKGKFKGTYWECLNDIPFTNWWKEIKW